MIRTYRIRLQKAIRRAGGKLIRFGRGLRHTQLGFAAGLIALSLLVNASPVAASGAWEEEIPASRPAHSETTSYSWFFKPNRMHTCPELDDSFRFIRFYDAWYADSDASDEDKVIYLTFDAGYDNGNIGKILDTLKKHKATGAFFVLEHLVKTETELVRRMIDEGHTVCNHTAKHHDMSKVTDRAAFEAELHALEDVYRETYGCELAHYYRPPEGKFSELNLQFATDMGYKTIFWSCAYADWDESRQPDPAAACEKLLSLTHNGMVILLHPTSTTNTKILDKLLCAWEKSGYRFGTLDELTVSASPES